MKCPFCNGDIHDEATVCYLCNASLGQQSGASGNAVPPNALNTETDNNPASNPLPVNENKAGDTSKTSVVLLVVGIILLIGTLSTNYFSDARYTKHIVVGAVLCAFSIIALVSNRKPWAFAFGGLICGLINQLYLVFFLEDI